MTYAETVAATSEGGIYEGWSMADSVISGDFVNGLFGQHGDNVCSVGLTTYGEKCGTLVGWQDNDFGVSYLDYYDHYAYLVTDSAAGLVGIDGRNGNVLEYENWSYPASVDGYSSTRSINFLLYRENSAHLGGFNAHAAEHGIVGSSSVPLPASGGLLALVLAGFAFGRKSKK